MADRYDPKLSVRPPGERRAAEPTDEGDPLAELARMVSGRSPADMGGRGQGSDSPAEADVERDLEAELLNDLQASFAALSGPLDTAPEAEAPDPEPAPAPMPATAGRDEALEPGDDRGSSEPEAPPHRPEPTIIAAPPPRRVEPRPPVRTPEPLSVDISQAFDEAEAAAARVVKAELQQARRLEREPRPYAPPLRGPAAQPRDDAPAPRETPAPRPPAPPRAIAPREAAPPVPAGAAPMRPERPAPPERAPARRAPPAPTRSERPNLPVRPLPMDDDMLDEDVPVPRVIASRAPRVEPSAAPPSRFAPQRSAAALPPPPAPAQSTRRPDPEPVYARQLSEDFELNLDDLTADDGPFEDEFTLDDLELGEYGPDDEFPPFPEEELSGRGRRRSGRVFALVAGVLAVVAVGGAAVFLFRGDGGAGSPPPIIAAEPGPTKVPPDQTNVASETDSQSKLIYDRVDEDGASGTRLVTGEAEIGSIPAEDRSVADNPISRVIIPGGPGIDSPVGEPGGIGEAVLADSGVPPIPGEETQSEIGPRMVRTVVVKPDGTIISSEATGVDDDGNALPGAPDDDLASTDDLLPALPRSEMDSVLEGGNVVVNTDPLSEPRTATQEPPPVAAAPEPIPTTDAFAPPAETATLPTPAPEPVQPPRQQVAARDAGGPINLTPGTAPASDQAPAAGGVLVQVAAQRSEEAALSSYRSLQQRYPNILGAFQPRIVRADLGERGIYYRVRVGPFNDGDAARLCGDLKAAGGDCILAR
jgi:hypothetical protein